MSDRPIGRLRAYAAGADAYDRGEPAQADQKGFAASRRRSCAKPGSNSFAAADKIEPLGRFIRATTTPPTRRKP